MDKGLKKKFEKLRSDYTYEGKVKIILGKKIIENIRKYPEITQYDIEFDHCLLKPEGVPSDNLIIECRDTEEILTDILL